MRFFKTFSERELKNNQKLVDKVLSLDDDMQKLTDEELKEKTTEFKNRLDKETLDDLLPEAFAVVREASDRVLGMKHYPVQIHGGIVLHNGQIAEMSTGSGKTLTETLPAYLNALYGDGVHIVTVNDYLAKRDMEQMGKIFTFLGLSTDCITADMTNSERQKAYNADITYGTNNQLGFDYLRDNMVTSAKDRVQRGLKYAIVDEVDSILIDEARTPLIISGQGDATSSDYIKADEFAKSLDGAFEDLNEEKDPFNREFIEEDVDYMVNEKNKTINLTGKGVSKAEKFFGVENLSDVENAELFHYINNALKANYTMKKDSDYVIKKGVVEIVDEFTGRILGGRRYSDGLHQAIEAKEGVEINEENKTLATVTFQNFFRMYDKLSGMTGTAMTEENEFGEIYNLDVVAIPDHKPKIREDQHDVIYISEDAKYRAIVEKIKEIHKTGQPILVGTTSVDKSEKISDLLKKENIKHTVLNAKNDDKEAQIIAQAGQKNSITIATNMAGRGTDIMLGGNIDYLAMNKLKSEGVSEELLEQADAYNETNNQEILEIRKKYKNYKNKFRPDVNKQAEEVKKLGGLYVLGTERHESRRIDNQLRGRSGRQGDPGISKFYISLDDDLIRLNMPGAIDTFKKNFQYDEDEPITGRMITRAVEKAQTRVEANNFHSRKNVLQYDDVMNKQRHVIYDERNRVLEGEDVNDFVLNAFADVIDRIVFEYTTPRIDMQDWKINEMIERLDSINIDMEKLVEVFLNTPDLDIDDGYTQKRISDAIYELAIKQYKEKEISMGEEDMRHLERLALIKAIDIEWTDHIDAMDQMRKEIGVRAMGNEDPLRAYTNLGFDMFEYMQEDIKESTVRMVLGSRLRR